MTCLDIIIEYLKAHGFDGLVNEDLECGCVLEDLQPCASDMSECKPGHKVAGCTCGEGCDFHIKSGEAGDEGKPVEPGVKPVTDNADSPDAAAIADNCADALCGLCGEPGADKVPHPVYWPGERRPGGVWVHAACEDEECYRAHAALSDEERERFLSRMRRDDDGP